jgi:hypothetical protein
MQPRKISHLGTKATTTTISEITLTLLALSQGYTGARNLSRFKSNLVSAEGSDCFTLFTHTRVSIAIKQKKAQKKGVVDEK